MIRLVTKNLLELVSFVFISLISSVQFVPIRIVQVLLVEITSTNVPAHRVRTALHVTMEWMNIHAHVWMVIKVY